MGAVTERPLVLFDGVCNLCESTVHFIIRRDKNARFRFAPLQSAAARQLVADYQYVDSELSSVLLIANGKLYQKSRAGLQIVKCLDGAWPLLYYLCFWIPTLIADPIYDYIGSRRYRWFGRKAKCWIPNDDLRRRFVEDPVVPDQKARS